MLLWEVCPNVLRFRGNAVFFFYQKSTEYAARSWRKCRQQEFWSVWKDASHVQIAGWTKKMTSQEEGRGSVSGQRPPSCTVSGLRKMNTFQWCSNFPQNNPDTPDFKSKEAKWCGEFLCYNSRDQTHTSADWFWDNSRGEGSLPSTTPPSDSLWWEIAGYGKHDWHCCTFSKRGGMNRSGIWFITLSVWSPVVLVRLVSTQYMSCAGVKVESLRQCHHDKWGAFDVYLLNCSCMSTPSVQFLSMYEGEIAVFLF